MWSAEAIPENENSDGDNRRDGEMKLRRIMALCLVLLLTCSLFVSCEKTTREEETTEGIETTGGDTTDETTEGESEAQLPALFVLYVISRNSSAYLIFT